MKKLRLGLIVLGYIITLNPCFASNAKPITSDKMDVENGKDAKPSIQVQETKHAQTSDDEQLAALFGKKLTIKDDLAFEEEFAKNITSGSKFIDLAPNYYTHKATCLLCTEPYRFSTKIIYLLPMPSEADCMLAQHLTIAANWLFQQNKLPCWYAIENACYTLQGTRHFGISTTISITNPCSTQALHEAYACVTQYLHIGWKKSKQDYNGYAVWERQLNVPNEDKIIIGFLAKSKFDITQTNAKAIGNMLYLFIKPEVFTSFEAKLWSLPKA